MKINLILQREIKLKALTKLVEEMLPQAFSYHIKIQIKVLVFIQDQSWLIQNMESNQNKSHKKKPKFI